MIISRTPLRISLAGGGTDFKRYYSRDFGAVTSLAINKYIYVSVNNNYNKNIRLSYGGIEDVSDVNKIKHGIIREALKLTGIKGEINISIMTDIPSGGTGLGSSSSLTVGVLNALWAYKNVHVNPKILAQQACEIEINKLKEPIGKQDQYIAAYGGFRYIRFNKDETVDVKPLKYNKMQQNKLIENLMLFYTGVIRKSSDILIHQEKNIPDRITVLDEMRNQAMEINNCLKNGDIDKIGIILDEAWELKKSLASCITNPAIDQIYAKAKMAGALGGKITGAGGGGFFLIYCPKTHQSDIRKTLIGLNEITIGIDKLGSKIVYRE